MDMHALEPRSVWTHFFTICSIPHPSHYEKALGTELLSWAHARGIHAVMDSAGNVIMKKPASAGKEGARGVILQAHLDMVPQAMTGSAHDFTRDPIRPRLDPVNSGWLVATGTTLGSDNGIGVAMAMAILEDDTLAHGPLECLFTTNEEDGMDGARAIEQGPLTGELLLNLDGEDDAELTIGCAGAIRTAAVLARPAQVVPQQFAWFEASVSGLLGGHSGVDIDKGRANATLALVGLLAKSREPLSLASISGGTAANAIPREARALIGLAMDRVNAFQNEFHSEATALRIALGDRDPGFTASLEPQTAEASPRQALAPADTEALFAVLGALPNGLVAMEPDMPGLIRTSLNLGRLSGSVAAGQFKLDTLVMVRSSSDTEKEGLGATVEKRLAGAADHGWSVSQSRPSVTPAWTPNSASPLLAETKTVYRELFGKDPRVTSTHGGLETGLFRPRFPAWDMISIGPNIRYPHSPDERVEIASVARSYRFVRELLTRL
ncbi:MAG: hypothetical protein A2Y38_21485 [Spirochaetes bacterium GWB1_59_5]|nr:MAG: hypothetical protein A2Y38_21485 [Spirochaetes bacterium GWB1_59_5]